MANPKHAMLLACLFIGFAGKAKAEVDLQNFCPSISVSPTPSSGSLSPAYELVKTDLASAVGGRFKVGDKIATQTFRFLGMRSAVEAPPELKLPPNANFTPFRMSDAGDPLRPGPLYYCTAVAPPNDRPRSNAICLSPDYRNLDGPLRAHQGTLSPVASGVFAGRHFARFSTNTPSLGWVTLGPPQPNTATFIADVSLVRLNTYIDMFETRKFGKVTVGFAVGPESVSRQLHDPISLEGDFRLAVTDVGGGDIIVTKMSADEWKVFTTKKCDLMKAGRQNAER